MSPWDSLDSIQFHGIHGIPWIPLNSEESLEFHGIHGVLRNQWISVDSKDFDVLPPEPAMEIKKFQFNGTPLNSKFRVTPCESTEFNENQHLTNGAIVVPGGGRSPGRACIQGDPELSTVPEYLKHI